MAKSKPAQQFRRVVIRSKFQEAWHALEVWIEDHNIYRCLHISHSGEASREPKDQGLQCTDQYGLECSQKAYQPWAEKI